MRRRLRLLPLRLSSASCAFASTSNSPLLPLISQVEITAHAGVHAGDVVLAIDGSKVESERDIMRVLATKRPGDIVRMDLRRNGQNVIVEPELIAP